MMSTASNSKRPAAAASSSSSRAVDLTRSDLSDTEAEQLSPSIDVVANPYKKSKPTTPTTVPPVSSGPHGRLVVAAPAPAPASVVADLTLPDDGDEPPELLQPEAVPQKQESKSPDEKKKSASASSASAVSTASPASAGAQKTEDDEKKRRKKKTSKATKSGGSDEDDIPGPIRPRKVPPLRSNPFDRTGPRWSTYEGKLLLRSAPPCKPTDASTKTKVAAFDMDGTILLTFGVRHASNFGDLQLWSSTVLDKIRSLHDDDGYRIVLITNQGGIRTQLDGKKATFIRSVIDWLAHEIDRPFNAVVSCQSDSGFHKGNAGMWSVAEQKFNGGNEFDLGRSFYVGDSIPGDAQVRTAY